MIDLTNENEGYNRKSKDKHKNKNKHNEVDEEIDDPEVWMRYQTTRQMEFKTKNDLRDSEGN